MKRIELSTFRQVCYLKDMIIFLYFFLQQLREVTLFYIGTKTDINFIEFHGKNFQQRNKRN
jgi:hypothetical protein